MKMLLIIALAVLLACFTQARKIEPEIFIPDGMPITLDVSLDENERGITKYNIKPVVGSDVDKVFIVTLSVGLDNQVKEAPGGFMEGEARLTTARVHEPASVAWASREEVRRFILIVERVEADNGVWVLDSEVQHANLKAIVERGRDALPAAKFIKKQ